MKPKIKGRNWWGRRLKNSWGGHNKMHSASVRIQEANQQIKEFLLGEKFVETQESNKSKEP